MGSLMAGWNSPRSKKGYERNLSLTKEEIEHYWRSKRTDQNVGAVAAAETSPEADPTVKKTIQKSSTFSASEHDHQGKASFLPVTPNREILKSRTFNGREAEVEVRPGIVGSAPSAWWTKTDFAFLNERPLESMDGPKYKYASQYNVVRKLKVDGEAAEGAISAVVF